MTYEKYEKVLKYVADSVETGYTSVFTFAVKELLTSQERQEFASFLRNLSASQSLSNFQKTNNNLQRY
jgi:hypothetical protein